MVPGVSGGSMAMILGIYDKLITSVSLFRNNKKESAIFLSVFSMGGILGMFLFASPLLRLIESYPKLLLYFFIGIVAGGVPMIYQKAEVKKVTVQTIFYPLLGAVIVLAFSMLPENLFQINMDNGVLSTFILIAAGMVSAVALVLPGISVSYLFLLMGIYDKTMDAVSHLNLSYLMPLGIGLIIGILLSTKLLENAMKHHNQGTYLIILGFVAGSMLEVFPGLPIGQEIIFCAAAVIAGFGVIQLLYRFENKKEASAV